MSASEAVRRLKEPLHRCDRGRCERCGAGWAAFLECEQQPCPYTVGAQGEPYPETQPAGEWVQRDLYGDTVP